MDYKDINKSDPDEVKEYLTKALEKFFPKIGVGDRDYIGPLGNGWFQVGPGTYTGPGGWEMFKKILKEQADGTNRDGSLLD